MRNTHVLAGASQIQITPPVGWWLVGPIAPSRGIHDDLFARALVLSDDRQARLSGQAVVLVCLDLCGMDFTFSDAMRAEIRQRTGITTALLNSSHTHSAPFTIPWREPWGWFQRDGQPWREKVVEKVVHIVKEASANLRPASLQVGTAPVQVGVHRRVTTEEGVTMESNPGGPLAPWVDVLRVNSETGDCMALLFSHAAHPLIVFDGGQLISADYPGFAVAAVRERLGEKTMAMFAQGCGANINGEPFGGGFEPAKEAGERLGAAAVVAANQGWPVSTVGPLLRTESLTLELPFQEVPTPEECEDAIAAARKMVAEGEREGKGEGDIWWLRDEVWGLHQLLQRAQRGELEPLRFEINMVAIGDQWCLLTMPHEVFVEYQLWASQSSPFPQMMIWAYTNGCECYVPTDEALSLGVRGGYEAGTFPAFGTAALAYRQRPALRVGIEGQIKEGVTRLWQRLA